jgi:radical SAM superfamily enzyme YgiQ (UPF0313 family)
MARTKGITVVLGGTHPSAVPSEALMHADSVVIGHADRTWPLLLRDFTGKKLKRVYRDSCPLPCNFSVVTPDRSLLGKGVYRFTNCIEATRGCPNGCEFCAVKAQNPSAVCRDLNNLSNEICTMGKYLLFLDSNHTEFKEYNDQLWPMLKDLGKRWFCASSMRFASDPARVKQAVDCGLRGVLIGFESVNQKALAGINKHFNSVEKYYESVKRLHDYGVVVFGNFIFGFDQDDESVFEKTVEFVIKAKIDIVRYAILTPLPSTPLYASFVKSNRIIDFNWGHYDTDHALFKPANMAPGALEAGLMRAYQDTYTYMSIAKRLNWTGETTLLSIIGNLGFRKLFKYSICGGA